MPVPKVYLANFNHDGIYHIYNRTNNKEKLFVSDENRRFFLKKYSEYLSPFVDTYCWCLLPTHFHLLVKVKSENLVTTSLQTKDFKDLCLAEKKFIDKLVDVNELISNSFKNFFQSYSLSFNKMYNRHGNLFYRPFKRVEIVRASQFTQTVVYIHVNPLKHKLIADFTQYQWSSWKTILSESPTKILRNEVIEWFGGKEAFINAHLDLSQFYNETDICIEDDQG